MYFFGDFSELKFQESVTRITVLKANNMAHKAHELLS